MFKKTLSLLLLAVTFSLSFGSYATEPPIIATDIDGRQIAIEQGPKRIVIQDGRDSMIMTLLDRDNPSGYNANNAGITA